MFYYPIYRGKKLLLFLTGIFCCSLLLGQVNITGANCVLSNLVYQYNIKGDWKANDKISICVEGGVLIDTRTSCVERQPVSFARVQWSEGKATGKITVSSQSGTAVFTVNIVEPFNPGFIQATDKQTIAYNKPSPSLFCTQANGGNCSPSFSYQWEQSSDKLKWIAISGATGRNLAFLTPLRQTTFFRRKVVETKSQTIGYSNEITVFVTPEIKKR